MKRKFDRLLMHKPDYPFFERIFYRPMASVLTPPIAKVGVSPTIMNFIGFFVGLGGIYLVATGDYQQRIAGAAVLIFSYILDCVDGQLARGMNLANRFGALLDTTLDSIKESLIFLALAWTYYLQTQDKTIVFYLVAALFSQRMFGRTLPWYRLLFGQEVEEIKKSALKHQPRFIGFLAYLFSESYRSGTIWIIVFLGVVSNEIKLTFIYFIAVILSLFIFLIFRAYQQRQK